MFDLRIALTPGAVESIKADLLRTLPNVKSCHRVEALARGLGFRTYAAMRAASRETSADVLAVDWQAFAGYLDERGFEGDAVTLYHAVARVAVKRVLQNKPYLTVLGINTGRRERNPDGTWESAEQYRERIKSLRREMIGSYGVEEFLRSLALLSRVKRTKTISASGSYWCKHIAESFPCTYPNGQKLGPAYVANGAFIAAGVHAGFVVREFPDSPNVQFNMSKKCLIDLDGECRPTGYHAQQRRWREESRKGRRILGY